MAQARTWVVEAHPETGEVDPEELLSALSECAVCLLRLGGATSQLAIRKRDPDAPPESAYFTERVVVQWVARTDSPPRAEEAPVAETAPDIEPPEQEPEEEPQEEEADQQVPAAA